MPSGIITKGIGGFYYVSSQNVIFECKARGIFRKNDLSPLIGDRVIFSVIDGEHRKGSIDQILERSSELVRPAVANVDQLLAVVSARSPEPDLLLLDKLLVTAEKKGISSVICINKIDLDVENGRAEIFDAYTNAGYNVIETCFKEENDDIEKIKSVLKGRITVFSGQSGVGKSTLLNRLMKASIMKTGAISDKIERGRHTTRHAELIKLDDDGFVVDTPGFSSFEISGIKFYELQYLFPEFGKYLGECRFSDCSHINQPDCSVKKAVEAGMISEGRYLRYIELYNLLKHEDDIKYKKNKREGKV